MTLGIDDVPSAADVEMSLDADGNLRVRGSVIAKGYVPSVTCKVSVAVGDGGAGGRAARHVICNFCGSPAAPPATGCQYGPGTLTCRACVEECSRWGCPSAHERQGAPPRVPDGPLRSTGH